MKQQMGGMGHGGVQEGDMAVVKTVESDELARVQNELQKEQKRLEDLVKLQKQELSNLKHHLGGKGLVGSPLATASNAPSPGARQDARTDKVQNNRTEERSESGWQKGGKGQLGGGASSVGWDNGDQRGMDGQVPYSIEKSTAQNGPCRPQCRPPLPEEWNRRISKTSQQGLQRAPEIPTGLG